MTTNLSRSELLLAGQIQKLRFSIGMGGGQTEAFVTLQNLKAAMLSRPLNEIAGNVFITSGYYTPGDSGANTYRAVAYSGAEDKGRYIRIRDGVFLEGLFPAQEVTYVQFGADPTGATPAHAEIVAAHAAANALKLPVRQNTGTFLWNADVSADVQTPTDLSGSVIKVQSGASHAAERYGGNGLFNITPSTYYSLDYRADLAEELTSFLLATDPEPQISSIPPATVPRIAELKDTLVVIESLDKVENTRSSGGTKLYMRDSFITSSAGELAVPINKDFRGSSGFKVIAVKSKESSRLVFSGLSLLLDGVSGITGVAVTRPQVLVQNITFKETVEVPDTIRIILLVKETFDVDVENIMGEAFTAVSRGSYGFTADSSVNVTVRKMYGHTGWGFMGTDFTKNFRIENSRLNRIDAHLPGYNFHIEGCTLKATNNSSNGVTLNGYGTLNIINTRFEHCVISARGDYGLMWKGDINIQRCKFVIDPDLTRIRPLFFLGRTSSAFDFINPSYLGKTITVKDITIESPANCTSVTVVHLAMHKANPRAVYLPTSILIENVKFANNTGYLPALRPLQLDNVLYARGYKERTFATQSVHSKGDYNMDVIIRNCDGISDVETGSISITGDVDTSSYVRENVPPSFSYPPATFTPTVRLSSATGTLFEVEGSAHGNGRYLSFASSIGGSGGESSLTNTNSSYNAFVNFSSTANTQYASGSSPLFDITTGVTTNTSATHRTTDDLGVVYDGPYVEIKLPSPITLTGYQLRNNNVAGAPKKYKIYGSNDRTVWTTLYTMENEDWDAIRMFKTRIVNATNAYLWYRIAVNEVIPGSDRVSFRWKLLSNPDQDTVVYPPKQLPTMVTNITNAEYGNGQYTAFSGSTAGAGGNVDSNTVAPFAAFSEDSEFQTTVGYNLTTGLYERATPQNTPYTDGGSTVQYAGDYLQLQLPSAVTATGLVMSRGATGTWPADYAVFGSTNGTTWNMLLNRVGQTWPSATISETFTTNIAAYTYYRIAVNRITAGSVGRLEIKRLHFMARNTRTDEGLYNENTYLLPANIYPRVVIEKCGNISTAIDVPASVTVDTCGVRKCLRPFKYFYNDSSVYELLNSSIRTVSNIGGFNLPANGKFVNCTFFAPTSALTNNTKVSTRIPTSVKGYNNKFDEIQFWTGSNIAALQNGESVSIPQISVLPTASNTNKGLVYYNTADNGLYYSNGTAWVRLATV